MLDQRTTAVLTTLITVGGTLGGVILGVILTSRYTSMQDKIKRNNTIIEEIYTLLFAIYSACSDIIDPTGSSKSLLKEVKEPMERSKILLSLYLPSLKPLTDIYLQNLSELGKAYDGYCELIDIDEDDKRGLRVEFDKIKELRKTYVEKDNTLRHALEKLVE